MLQKHARTRLHASAHSHALPSAERKCLAGDTKQRNCQHFYSFSSPQRDSVPLLYKFTSLRFTECERPATHTGHTHSAPFTESERPVYTRGGVFFTPSRNSTVSRVNTMRA